MTAEPRRATRPRRPVLRHRDKKIGIIGALAATVVAGLLVTGLLTAGDHPPAGGHPPAGARHAGAREPGPIGVAAAYGYPLGCLSVAIALQDPRFARADFDHAAPCGRYAGYDTAIFRRVDGAWVPVLEATSYPCPVRSLPVRVQVELGVFLPRTPAHARRARGSSRASAATPSSSKAS